MPPKRKSAAIEDSPAKRRLRSGTIIDTPSAKRVRTTPTKPRASPRKQTLRKQVRESDFSDDELALLPAKEQPVTPKKSTVLAGLQSVPDSEASDSEDELVLPQSPTKKRKTSPSLDLSLQTTPSKNTGTKIVTPQVSPSKKRIVATTPQASPSRLPRVLPLHLHPCLNAQKRAILRALQNPPDLDDGDDDADDTPPTNSVAYQQLADLLDGSVSRGEGNSCLLLGPRGSGKTRLIERCLSTLKEKPIVLRLSGWAHLTDRLAMREIAYQLTQQTGGSFLSADNPDSDHEKVNREEDVNPFLDIDVSATQQTISLPSSSHLPALIALIPTLSRPTVVVIDGFDLFSFHARQLLLYCLLDTVQSCHAGHENKGLAVIGVTSRVDTINLLEKRVKSRFSGRTIRTAPPSRIEDWTGILRKTLCAPISGQDIAEDDEEEWSTLWKGGVDRFLEEKVVVNTLNETFSVTRDIRVLSRLMTTPILELTPSSPFLSSPQLVSAATTQRCRPRYPFLHSLPYPSVCLLVASVHSQTAGHDTITFEMLHECFRDQVRASTSAPVQVNGGSIGMLKCSREILMSAFETLISAKIFILAAAPAPSIAKEFVKYRCVVEREDIKAAVTKMGQTNLKKWLTKAQ